MLPLQVLASALLQEVRAGSETRSWELRVPSGERPRQAGSAHRLRAPLQVADLVALALP